MSRQLENLKRMLEKLKSRYGVDDEIVSQFKQEVESLESEESACQKLPVASAGGVPGTLAQRRRKVAARHPSGDTDIQ